MIEKSTTIKRTTDKLYDFTSGSVKYRTTIDKLNKFIETEQLLDVNLWKSMPL